MNISNIVNATNALVRQQDVPLEQQPSLKVLLACEYFAFALPLPTSRVSDPKQPFTTQCKLQALDWVTRLNEQMVLERDDAVELIYDIWRIRYSLVHEGPSVRYGRLITGANRGVNGAFSEEYRSLALEYPTLFLTESLVNGV